MPPLRQQVEGILQVGVDVVDMPLRGLNVFVAQNPLDGLGADLVGVGQHGSHIPPQALHAPIFELMLRPIPSDGFEAPMS